MDISLRTICIGNPQLNAFFMRKRMRHRSPVLKLMSGGVHYIHALQCISFTAHIFLFVQI
jgi:hypothetical protein